MTGAEVLAALEALSRAAGAGQTLNFHHWSGRDLPWWVSIPQVAVSTPSGHFHTGALGSGASADEAAADLFRRLAEPSGGEYAVVNPFGDRDGRRRATWVGDRWHIVPAEPAGVA